MDCQAPNTVYLTFDDGPHQHTRRILNILNEYGAKATFFVVGRNAKHQPHLIRAIVDEGHDVGNHSYSHPNLHKLSGADARFQVEQTQTVLANILGDHVSQVRWWRAPYGNYVPMKVGMTHMLWSIDTHDYLKPHPIAMMDKVLDRVRHKSVVLMHDHSASTMAGLEYLVSRLTERGYQLAGLRSFDRPTCTQTSSPTAVQPLTPQPTEKSHISDRSNTENLLNPTKTDDARIDSLQSPSETNEHPTPSPKTPSGVNDDISPAIYPSTHFSTDPAINQASHVRWD